MWAKHSQALGATRLCTHIQTRGELMERIRQLPLLQVDDDEGDDDVRASAFSDTVRQRNEA